MQSRRLDFLGLGSVLLFVACAGGGPETAGDYSAAVATIAEDAWDQLLAQSPYLQNRQGLRVTELPDLSEEQAAANVAWSREMLDRIDAIPLDELSHEDALTLECIRWDNQIAVESEPYYWLQFPITPYSAGYMGTAAQLMLGSYTFVEADEREQYLGLVGEFGDSYAQMAAHTEGQAARGIYVSKHALPAIVGLFQAMRGGMMRGAATVSAERLAAIPEEEREAFSAAVDEAITNRLEPGIDRVLAVLTSEDYQANAPDAVGLAHYPDGEAYYRYLVKANTTMNKTPAELHETLERIEVAAKSHDAELLLLLTGCRHNIRTDDATIMQHEQLRFAKQRTFGTDGRPAFVDGVSVLGDLVRVQGRPVESLLLDEAHPSTIYNGILADLLVARIAPWIAKR